MKTGKTTKTAGPSKNPQKTTTTTTASGARNTGTAIDQSK